ncbi:MAG: roadblock/LC7 domain-containing protein [Desulfobacterales bacterium]|jgi:predicted regulator of Ras-like GTPase activity (Roadblock/LC7/MglB family)
MPSKTFAEKIEEVLIDLRALTPDVEGAVLVDMNGLPITSVISNGVNDTIIAAMASAMLRMGERTVDELEKGRLHRVLVQAEKGYVVLVEAGRDAVLAVVTTERAKLGMIFVDANFAAEKVATLLANRR